MSRLGKKPIPIPSGVTIQREEALVRVQGPKGTVTMLFHPSVSVEVKEEGAEVRVKHPETKQGRALWGTFASHLKNMIHGVTEMFEKKLEVNGVGYRASIGGKTLTLHLGFSHPVTFSIPDDIEMGVEKNIITVRGVDKYRVGLIAAGIRQLRPPEPYKGKGIKYLDEILRRKAGKATKIAE